MISKRASLWALLVGQLISSLGSTLSAFTLSFHLFKQTTSAAVLATILFARFFPSTFLSIFAGAFVDRFPRKTVLVGADLGLAALATVVAMMVARQHLSLSLLYVVLFIEGVVDSVQSVAFQAAIPTLVPKEKATQFYSWFGVAVGVPATMGPFFGAWFAARYSVHVAYVIDAVTFLIAAALTTTVTFGERLRKAPRMGMVDLTLGWNRIVNNPVLCRLQLFFAGMNFWNAMAAGVVPAFILARTHFDPDTMAWSSFAMNASGLLGGMLAATIAIRRPTRAIGVMLLAAAIVGRIALPLLSSTYLCVLALAVRGLLIAPTNALNQAAWLENVDPAEGGKIFGTRRLLSQGAYPFALLAGGFLAQRLSSFSSSKGATAGFGVAIALFGIGELAVALMALLSPKLKQFDDRYAASIAAENEEVVT